MLVLSRKAGQGLKIGDDITVIVKRVASNRVTLGVIAPKQLKVIRSELEPEPVLATRIQVDPLIAVIDSATD